MGFELVALLAGFGALAAVPVLLIPYLLAPKRPDPVKEAPFECGQIPTGEGRTHFMMQYYAYLLMFVVFDVMAMFLYAWGVSLRLVPYESALPILIFLGVMFVPMGYALVLAGRRELW